MTGLRLRVIVVDDEPLARERLRQLLAVIPGVRLVAMADDAESAVRLIKRERPHIVLLDIELATTDGLWLAASLDAADRPLIIFVTAHLRYAADAFNVEAVDYVPKPVDPERLQLALERARARVETVRMPVSPFRLAALSRALMSTARLERLAVRHEGRVMVLRATEIVRVEAHGNSVHVIAAGRTHRMRGSLTQMARRLPPSLFARANRSVIVNLDHLRVADPWTRGTWQLTLSDGAVIETTRLHGHELHLMLAGAE